MFNQEIKCIGFDMDGTLYDEYQFIEQAYKSVAEYIGEIGKKDKDTIYDFMISKWKEKGSSYSYLFQDALCFSKADISADSINECVNAYRNATFKLSLSNEMEQILENCVEKYELFIVTDGNAKLQMKKIKALNLERWFCPENIYITGEFGKEAYKPSTLVLQNSMCIKKYKTNEICYCGDRKVDYEFACNAGFHFVEMRVATKSGNVELRRIR